ncbi:YggS family pyridoxal phosphate-dependent enzyme [Altericista sp. CCNU0014]|uniref:YggS family pyridoxal phosphate-dependent enzyme n=1 Tax=Altericista sp. CCNU0014 TaxID=3082949 RepID=UPI00384EDF72
MSDWSVLSSVAERVAHLRNLVPPSVRTIAVSKTVPSSLMREAYAAGIRDFGESRLQEAILKQQELADLSDIAWHFIGHLQSNKAKQALQHFQWIHSVDSLAIAQRLDLLAAELQVSPQICLQVKLKPDPNKFGWTAPELLEQLPLLQPLQHLRIQGLMTILPLGLSPAEQLETFQSVRDLAQTIRQHPDTPLPLTELSMGMSSDYALAVRAGTTMIRPGRILFGERKEIALSQPAQPSDSDPA